MKTAIAIFAKTPGVSAVKTRLAADIGKEQAEAFYGLSVKAIEAVVAQACDQSDGRLTPFWALAEEACVRYEIWNGFSSVWTGEGGLGQRMQSVSARLLEDHDQVLLIGTDSPQISYKLILEAIDQLMSHPDKCVIGPSFDGGFYLLGSSFPIHPDIWANVTYSQEDTLDQLIDQLSQNHILCRFMEPVGDVDHHQDLKMVQEALAQQEDSLLPSQKSLLDWLRAI